MKARIAALAIAVSALTYGAGPLLAGGNQYPGAQSATGHHNKMSPQKLQELKALLGERAQELFGEGPAGATYEGYREVRGTSPKNPCKPGYQPVQQQQDPETGRLFFRCFKE